jgi:molecular chaperone DnaK (HSP70)
MCPVFRAAVLYAGIAVDSVLYGVQVQVAAFQNDRVEVVSNDYGNRTTPSLVLYDASCQEYLVGEPALAKAHKLQPAADAASALTPAKIAQLQFGKLKQDAEAFIGQVRLVIGVVSVLESAETR